MEKRRGQGNEEGQRERGLELGEEEGKGMKGRGITCIVISLCFDFSGQTARENMFKLLANFLLLLVFMKAVVLKNQPLQDVDADKLLFYTKPDTNSEVEVVENVDEEPANGDILHYENIPGGEEVPDDILATLRELRDQAKDLLRRYPTMLRSLELARSPREMLIELYQALPEYN